ncbi:hypothetical protein HU200_053811 [Digitaria exilis]|uniref:Uncharacterized protein n=1 Tax=Digitaria exilis TaxID=1010633 RepID=A0A835AR16_9POAL|nr:hypothetical protein HU200_053811 [Digitaria exilis]
MWEQRQRHNPAEGEDWFARENPVYLRWFYRVARTRLRPMGMEYNMEDVQIDEEDNCYVNTRGGNQPEPNSPSSSHRAGKAPASPQESDDDVRGDDSEDLPSLGFANQFIFSQDMDDAPPYTQTQGVSSLMNMTKSQGESSQVALSA